MKRLELTVAKIWTALALAFAVGIAVGLAIGQWSYLRWAHASFESYYAFRGCVQLIEKTDDYGVCRTGSGQTVQIVKYQDKWYLDGDLPWGCLGGFCVGI